LLEIICKTSGIWLWRRVLRTSWARSGGGRQRGENGRTGEATLNDIECTLDFALFSLVDVLLVVSNDALREGLSDGVDLGDVATTADTDADIKILESLESEEEDGLEDLGSQGLGFEELDGGAIDTQHALAGAD
jgi:hypothetical protein